MDWKIAVQFPTGTTHKPDRLWSPPNLLRNEYRGPFPDIYVPEREAGHYFACSAYAKNKLKTKLRGHSPQANYTDRATAAVGEVVPTFAGRGCYAVSVTDSHGR
jgi:hypothetical protein